MEYLIKQCEVGYVITNTMAHGMISNMWAFSTLEEALEYMPSLFNKETETGRGEV
jgi:hypothetical protein